MRKVQEVQEQVIKALLVLSNKLPAQNSSFPFMLVRGGGDVVVSVEEAIGENTPRGEIPMSLHFAEAAG